MTLLEGLFFFLGGGGGGLLRQIQVKDRLTLKKMICVMGVEAFSAI